MFGHLKTKEYIIAYKNTEERDTLYTAIPNDYGCWAADPFVFNNEGVTYIFAEIYFHTKDKGSLGYCKLVDGKPSKWKIVIEENYHLSYPNIFTVNGEIYMCPESSENNTIYYYKAIQFPDQWEKGKALVSGMMCVDTTFLKKDDEIYGFTYRIDHKLHDLLLFKIDDGRVEFSTANPINTDLSSARPGGKILNENGKFIRVSQDCTPYYGHGLVLSEMELHWPYYSEKIIKKIYPENININIDKKFEKIGIHTYNRNDQLEVIDLQTKRMSMYTLFWKVRHKLCKSVTKFLTHAMSQIRLRTRSIYTQEA